MKKLLLLLAATAFFLSSYAQYFGHNYSPQSHVGNGGIIRTLPTPGHFIVGTAPIGTGNGVLHVTADSNGTPSKNGIHSYKLGATQVLITSALGIAPVPMDTSDIRVVFGYKCSPAPPNPIYECGMAIYGSNATGVKSYSFTNLPHVSSVTVTGVSKYKNALNNETQYLVTGQIRGPSESTYIYAMRFAPNGVTSALGKVYQFNTPQSNFVNPTDIIYNPYNLNEIYIIGTITFPGQPAQATDAFCLTVNWFTGQVIKSERYDAGAYDGFNAISLSDDPIDPGFILTGYTQQTPAQVSKPWAVKTDVNNSVSWSKTYDSPLSGPYTTGNDVTGRLNTLGNYEYYITGRKGVAVSDALTLKLDANGTLVSQGAGLQGLFAQNSYAASVDIKNAGPGTGVSYYMGNTDPNTLATNVHIRKTYFNGKSGCVEFHDNGTTINSPVVISPLPASVVGGFIGSYLDYNFGKISTDNTVCFANTIPEGSNAKTTTGAVSGIEALPGISLTPNPATEVLNFELDNSFNLINATVIVTNIQGQCVLKTTFSKRQGQLNISDLPTGFYLAEFRNNETSKVLKFAKQ